LVFRKFIRLFAPYILKIRQWVFRSMVVSRIPESQPHTQRRRLELEVLGAIRTWLVRKHGQVNFYLAQLLSSHGCSRDYLRWLGHEDSARHAAKMLILLATQKSTFLDCIPQDILLGTQ